jgi:hypothetical protein
MHIMQLEKRESVKVLLALSAVFSFDIYPGPLPSLRMVGIDPFLIKVGQVAFLFYTGLWAITSTLSVYVNARVWHVPEDTKTLFGTRREAMNSF